MGLLLPARRRGREILDDSFVDAATRVRSTSDIARSNRLFGGRRAAVAAVENAIEPRSGALSLLDVGTGVADIPAELARRSTTRGVTIAAIGLDASADLLHRARRGLTHVAELLS